MRVREIARQTALFLLAFGLFGGLACSVKPATKPDSKNSSETISAEGSSTVYPICQAFAVAFEKKTNHKVSVGRQGTGGGFTKFLNKQADIWNASRPVAEKEIEQLKAKGIEWVELNIAVDGIVIAVNSQNTWCKQITCAQLKQIWEPESKIKTWKDLNPDWPADSIALFGADTDSGTFEYFTEMINGKKKATNTNYTPSSDDNVLVQGVATNKNALGYIPFGYCIVNTEKLTMVAVSSTKDPSETAAPFVHPTAETILSGEYAPLTRPLFMNVSKDSLKRPEVASFVQFAVSDEAQPLIKKRFLVPVTPEVLALTQKKFKETLAELDVASP